MSNSLTNNKEIIKEEKYLLEFNGIEEYMNYDSIKNPYNFRSWWNTLIAASDAPYDIRIRIYESALKFLPGSYKLWFHYLKEARENVMRWSVDDIRYEVINELHERALIIMNKMPRIWTDYCQFLIEQRLVTKTRLTFDKALMSLPVTQHDKIWGLYVDWARDLPILQTAINVFKRYLRVNPDAREDFINYLVENGKYEESLKHIIELLDDDLFYSKKGKTKFDYWQLLCNIISKYPDQVNQIDCESIIKHGLNKYTDEVGRLWVALCNYYIKQGLFEKARDIFEESLSKVSTARDFSLVFNAYLKFEEELINNMISLHQEEKILELEYENGLENLIDLSFNQLEINKKNLNSNLNNNFTKNESNLDKTDLDLNMKIFRMTNLIERRPFLLSDALLRQNPNNVKEWLKRIKICQDDEDLTVQTYEDALRTVDPFKVFGRVEKLWTGYANFFEHLNQLGKANEIFYRATQYPFKSVEGLGNIWLEWSEMHLRNNNYYDAYMIIKMACSTKKVKGLNICNSIKVWSLYVDLEEHFGTIENVKTIYQRMIDLKIANAQTIFNYCHFLEKHLYFEETFRVYEQAINYFSWPHAYNIWLIYLTKFVERYKGDKIERARDLFEQVLAVCPKDKIKIFYYMYSDLEENFGLLNHCIRILDKGCSDVVKDERPEMYSVLISKTANFFGITKTRTIFSRALEILDTDQVIDIGLKFAVIEKKLGEINRARAILVHLSQFSDPSKEDGSEGFWQIWEEFELNYGNEDSYTEMMRTKRSVSARYSLNAPIFIVENKLPL